MKFKISYTYRVRIFDDNVDTTFIAGLILESLLQQDRSDFEFKLQQASYMKK